MSEGPHLVRRLNGGQARAATPAESSGRDAV